MEDFQKGKPTPPQPSLLRQPPLTGARPVVLCVLLLAMLSLGPNKAVVGGLRSVAEDGGASTPAPLLDRVQRVDRFLDNSSAGEVTETQHAICQVSGEDLVAKAEATVTRVLKGVCNAKQVEDGFQHLETQIDRQLSAMKSLILNMEERLQEQDAAARRVLRRVATAALRCDGNGNSGSWYNGGGNGGAAGGKRPWSNSVGGSGTSGGSAEAEESPAFAGSDAVTNDTTVTAASGRAEQAADAQAAGGDGKARAGPATGARNSVPSASATALSGPRGEEIHRYNSTIHALPDGRDVFTYYWRVAQISSKLTQWGTSRSVRSPSFYISQGGYRMYLRLYPRRSGTNVYVHAGLTTGAYDAALDWPFALKLRVSVLEQSPGASEDVTSRVWDATELCSGFNWQRPLSGDSYECVGLGLPHEVIRSRRYIWKDSILLKLVVYLT